jgi:hypothetical protein
MNPDGTAQTQLTNTAGINLSPQWGIRMLAPGDK